MLASFSYLYYPTALLLIYAIMQASSVEQTLLWASAVAWTWTWFSMRSTRSTSLDELGELTSCLTYWAAGHRDVWAPALLSTWLVLGLIAGLCGPTMNHPHTYVPRRKGRFATCRTRLKKVCTWAISGLITSRAWVAIGGAIDGWWQQPARRKKASAKRQSGRTNQGTRAIALKISRKGPMGKLTKNPFKEGVQFKVPREDREYFFDACQGDQDPAEWNQPGT
jgi:hypothetical protein